MVDALERLKQADPARGAAGASRAERVALAERLLQQRPGVKAHVAPRRFVVVPIAIAAALAISVIGFAQPTRATLAWSPTANTSPLAPSAELKTVCTEGMPITAEQLDLLADESIDLVDSRGNASLVVWSTPTLRLHCLVLSDDSGALVRGPAMLSEPVAQNSAQLSLEFMAGAEWMSEMVMVLSGRAPDGTAEVAIVGQELEDFSASVNSTGQFAVWWPSTGGATVNSTGTGRVVARDAAGNELASRNLTDYYVDAGARQTAPPADETSDEAGSDSMPELPGGDMLDLRIPGSPVGGGDGTFEPAQITNVRVPTEVQAGTPLVIRFRMTDPSGYQAPVAFIGGPNGWVSDWCGFGIAATRVSGDQRDGEYEISCLVPSNVPSAGYITQIGCECTFPDDSEEEAAYVTYEFNIVGGSSDLRAPQIFFAEITSVGSPGEIRPGTTFEVTTLASDESGIAYVVAWVEGPNGRLTNERGELWAPYLFGSIVRSPADNGLEKFVQTITLRDDATPGLYRIWFSVGDLIGNREALYGVTLIQFKID
jgi:hypothetical protein